MKYQTIRQVTQTYGISRRMLSYYEEVGLLSSHRTRDYAYRMYDETAITQLQQIIILRKLQIPVKQIKEILVNQDAVLAIEIFQQNIKELDDKMTAMATLKTILSQFVNALQKSAGVTLKLDLPIPIRNLAKHICFVPRSRHKKICLARFRIGIGIAKRQNHDNSHRLSFISNKYN